MNTTNSFNNNVDSNNKDGSGSKVFVLIDAAMPYILIFFLVVNSFISAWILFRVYNIQNINKALQETIARQQKMLDDQAYGNSKIDKILLNQAEGKLRSYISTNKIDSIKSKLK